MAQSKRVLAIDDDGSTGSGTHGGANVRILHQAQLLLLKYPVASQAAFSAFVAEGRAFAQTDEGADLKGQLMRSPRLARMRELWDIGTLNILEETSTELLPSTLIEMMARAASAPALEPLLSRLLESLATPDTGVGDDA